MGAKFSFLLREKKKKNAKVDSCKRGKTSSEVEGQSGPYFTPSHSKLALTSPGPKAAPSRSWQPLSGMEQEASQVPKASLSFSSYFTIYQFTAKDYTVPSSFTGTANWAFSVRGQKRK